MEVCGHFAVPTMPAMADYNRAGPSIFDELGANPRGRTVKSNIKERIQWNR